jgi:RND family efflux transporter MFP subunit
MKAIPTTDSLCPVAASQRLPTPQPRRFVTAAALVLALAIPALAAEVTPTVAAVKIGKESIVQAVSFEAELRPFEEISLHSKISGYLKSIDVEFGDTVKKGQVIATLEVPELESEREHVLAAERRAQAEIKRAQAEIQRAEAGQKEAGLLHSRIAAADKSKSGLIAPQDLDTAKSKVQIADATLAVAEAALAVAKQQVEAAQADVRKVNTLLGFAKVTAPFDGVITRRYLDPGALVQAGTGSSALPLVRLSQSNKLRVAFPVSLSFVTQMKAGAAVEVRIPATGRTFKTTIARSTRRVETATRTMEVEADLDNADLALIPGMYATVVVKLENRQASLVAPVEAVSRAKEGSTVYLVNADRKIEERTVKIGMETPSMLEISSGLVEGDIVMVGGRSQLKPGQTVDVKMVQPLKHD